MPCHRNLETHLAAYIEGAGIIEGRCSTIGRDEGRPLSRTPLRQANAYAMVVGVDGPTAACAKVELSDSNQGPPE
jgi:hypothetical protein